MPNLILQSNVTSVTCMHLGNVGVLHLFLTLFLPGVYSSQMSPILHF